MITDYLSLAELKRLEAEATPGPWRSMRDGNQFVETSHFPTAKCVGASRLDGVVRPWNPHHLIAFGFKPIEYETARFIDADADLIEALRNHAGALIAAAERLEEVTRPPEVNEWKELVRLAYADGGDAVLRIARITAEYNRMRKLAGLL